MAILKQFLALIAICLCALFMMQSVCTDYNMISTKALP